MQERLSEDILSVEALEIDTGLSDEEIIKLIRSYLEESERRKDRKDKNKENIDAYFDRQDFSYKQPDQSKEFIPRTFVTVERIARLIVKQIQDNSQFFSIDTGKVDIDKEDANKLLTCYLSRIGRNGENFFDLLEKAIKIALLKGEMIAKVSGRLERKQEPTPDGDVVEKRAFYPTIDIIDPDDFYADPTGNGLYEIYKTEVDLHELVDAAEDGLIDKEALEDFKDEEIGRKRIKIAEVYGDFIGKGGKVVARRAIATIALEKDVILHPVRKNPFWHGESPFVRTQLVISPTNETRALMDPVTGINFAMNELFNLMLDGGIGSALGVRLVRPAWLEDPSDAEGGITHGSEIKVRGDLPIGARPVEFIQMGNIPQDALSMYAILDRIIVETSVFSDVSIGRAPPKEATATEIVSLQQSQNIFADRLLSSIESFIQKVLRKVWLIIAQNIEFLKTDDLVSAVGFKRALQLISIPPEERFSMFSGCGFRIVGLSDALKKRNELSQLLGFMQTVLSNPVLANTFFMRFDPVKIINKLASLLNVDVSDIALDEEQIALQQIAAAQQARSPIPVQPPTEGKNVAAIGPENR